MKKSTNLVFTIIILILIVLFTLQNTGEVSITLFLWNIETSLALLIVSIFSFGIIIAIIVLTPRNMALRSALKENEKIISEFQKNKEVYSEKEIENE